MARYGVLIICLDMDRIREDGKISVIKNMRAIADTKLDPILRPLKITKRDMK